MKPDFWKSSVFLYGNISSLGGCRQWNRCEGELIRSEVEGEDLAVIRELRKADINIVADIWLDTNIKAHSFIPAQYWKRNLELVKELLLQATVYVYEGIFVSEAMQSQGIGKILLNYVKDIRSKLLLSVYQKNIPAISFYQREGFEIQYSGMDEATGEKDYVMVWQQK